MRGIFTILFLFITTASFSQLCESRGVLKSWGVLSSIDYSYTGVSISLAPEFEKGKHAFYLGPKLAIKHSYHPQQGPFGGVAGYRYLFLSNQKRWNFFFNTDYQLTLQNSFKRTGEAGNKKNHIHQFNVSYGARFKLTDQLFLGNSIGVGRYYESYYNYRSGERISFSGFDGLIRFFVKYRFAGR